jgi:uncharacterized protein (TIGR03437 family)
MTVLGNNLSKVTATAWDVLPAQFHNVSVTIHGVSSFVRFISPTQVNVLIPWEVATSGAPIPAVVSLTTSEGTAQRTIEVHSIAPSLFADGRNAAAINQDGSLNGTGTGKKPAAPGTIVSLYGSGFGQSVPPVPSNFNSEHRQLLRRVEVTVGGVAADVKWAGLAGVGLYQVNVEIPASTADGDQPVVVKVDGVPTQDNVEISVRN